VSRPSTSPARRSGAGFAADEVIYTACVTHKKGKSAHTVGLPPGRSSRCTNGLNDKGMIVMLGCHHLRHLQQPC
jgi:hypothetical protein